MFFSPNHRSGHLKKEFVYCRDGGEEMLRISVSHPLLISCLMFLVRIHVEMTVLMKRAGILISLKCLTAGKKMSADECSIKWQEL